MYDPCHFLLLQVNGRKLFSDSATTYRFMVSVLVCPRHSLLSKPLSMIFVDHPNNLGHLT
jgi:hypothetical protein